MIKFNNKLYFILFLSIIVSKASLALDKEIQDLLDNIDSNKVEFNKIKSTNVPEAIKIDEAFNEIDKISNFVKNSLNNGDEESAINALEFIEKSLSGVNSLAPKRFSSDMSNIDLKVLVRKKCQL